MLELGCKIVKKLSPVLPSCPVCSGKGQLMGMGCLEGDCYHCDGVGKIQKQSEQVEPIGKVEAVTRKVKHAKEAKRTPSIGI